MNSQFLVCRLGELLFQAFKGNIASNRKSKYIAQRFNTKLQKKKSKLQNFEPVSPLGNWC